MDKTRIYEAFANWVRYYKGKEKQTRFGVQGCGVDKKRLLLRDSENIDDVAKTIVDYMPYGGTPVFKHEFFQNCFSQVYVLLKEENGGRPDAPDVVLRK